jgi:hypothetical protein
MRGSAPFGTPTANTVRSMRLSWSLTTINPPGMVAALHRRQIFVFLSLLPSTERLAQWSDARIRGSRPARLNFSG